MSEDKKEIAKNLVNVDGFDGAEDIGVEGEEEGQQSNSRVIQGGRLGFTNDYTWTVGENEPFNTARELVAVDTARVMQKWVDKMPAGHMFIPADQKWPNLDELNNRARNRNGVKTSTTDRKVPGNASASSTLSI